MPRLKVDPFMDPLSDDPRFKEMLKRLICRNDLGVRRLVAALSWLVTEFD